MLEEDDDFDFAPSFTPKSVKGPGAFAPSPVQEEDDEVEEEQALPSEEIVEEEGKGEVVEEVPVDVAVEPAAEPKAPPSASEAAEERASVALEPTAAAATETVEADDAFERKLLAAMEAAERGGGLAGLSGGMQNSPPGSKPAFEPPAASLLPVTNAALSNDPRRDETPETPTVHSDDDTVELQADVDVSMMDVEPRAQTPVSRGVDETPRAPAAVLAALESPAEDSRAPTLEPCAMPASRENENASLETAKPKRDDAPSTKRAPTEADDAFERKLLAAMEAAERGGGLAGLSGGMQNSPPGSKPAFEPPAARSPPGHEDCRTTDATEDEARASVPVLDEKEEKPMAEVTAAELPPRRKAKAKAPTDPDPELETERSAPSAPALVDDDAFERKLLAAMEAAERGGGLAGLSGGMQNSPPGSKAAEPTQTAAAPESSSPRIETVDGDAVDVCGMDHDAPPTPKEPPAALALSPVAAAAAGAPASATKRGAKPPRSGKKSKRATRRRESGKEEPKDGDDETTRSADEEGPSPPAADFEAMLAKAMAAADGGDVDAVLGGASSKMVNSPAPLRRRTPARLVKAKTPEGTPTRVSTRSSARFTRASAAKTKESGLARQNAENTPMPRGKKRVTPTPEKKKEKGKKPAARAALASKPAWVSDVHPEAKEGEEASISNDRSHSESRNTSDDPSPVPEAPAAPPPPPVAWLKKAAEAKTSRKPEWVSDVAAPAPALPQAAAAPVLAAPVAPVAAPVVIATLAAAQSRVEASTASDGFDFEAKLQAALAAEAGGGAAAFGGASKVANSPTGSGEKRTAFSAKEEARRQGVTVAQIMHARAHADSSPLTKVRF